ncbi:hypothetical protein Riv7116_2104 [Rivularia sp. PCC 7116]|uniref:hypothetical protein n=1 Tax=Rivularia sp. PCC 7116 TaxID=373994 RepID=UPI00029EE893|nr:hypothetical protein [Rivularia sp. PCC 7116]AFY54635.1 hypothetical protein Riv7116_2104 [Rivularia sp. PCC 7116]
MNQKTKPAFKKADDSDYILIHKRHLGLIEKAFTMALGNAHVLMNSNMSKDAYRKNVFQQAQYELDKCSDDSLEEYCDGLMKLTDVEY